MSRQKTAAQVLALLKKDFLTQHDEALARGYGVGPVALMDPLDRACPACNAKPHQPCTTPTDTGRRDVKWVHYLRLEAL